MVQFRLTDAQPPLPGKKSERPLSIFFRGEAAVTQAIQHAA